VLVQDEISTVVKAQTRVPLWISTLAVRVHKKCFLNILIYRNKQKRLFNSVHVKVISLPLIRLRK